jgi:hypothetical protein
MNASKLIRRLSPCGIVTKYFSARLPALVGIVTLALAFFAGSNIAHAQNSVVGTRWDGQENLTGQSTNVTFKFLSGGQVTMTGSNGQGGTATYSGTYSQQGNQVVLQFPSIGTTFQGVMSGVCIQGQGHEGGHSWNFSVVKGGSGGPF